ncbi:MAG: Maf family protein [Anaerolineales bacterium]|nr:Maf family protein [Anaerolineales bacterium]
MLESCAMNTLLLASNSPRRRELLTLGDLAFDAVSADVDETPRAGESPREYVIRLAQAKARAAAQQALDGQIIIGSDTTVAADDSILGKPADEADAARMLNQLRGRTHQVYTGIAVYRARDEKTITELCAIDVPMRAYTDDEIAAYIQTRDPMDKAGAYAIQHAEFNPVEEMRGCYAGVMGLPLCHLARALQKMDISFAADISSACQNFLKYECSVSNAILRGE